MGGRCGRGRDADCLRIRWTGTGAGGPGLKCENSTLNAVSKASQRDWLVHGRFAGGVIVA
jgi:hypothetical protein